MVACSGIISHRNLCLRRWSACGTRWCSAASCRQLACYLALFVPGGLLLLSYWILSGHLYPPVGWVTAWKPLTEAKWVHLDEEELAYGSLDKDGFELVCGAALYLVLIGTAWIILPVIFSTIVLYTILAFKPHFDTELVYWGLLMLIIAELRLLKMGKAADLVEQSVHETLTYYAFPDIHWQKIRTNSPLERIMREIRRRTRVVGAFPDGQSCLNLAAARLRHIAGTQWSTKRYMNMRPLLRTEETLTEAAIARKNVRKNLDTTKRIWKIRCFITVVWETRFQGG